MIKRYENTLSYLNSLQDSAISDETDKGEKLRQQLIFQDFINRGYSKERAQKIAKNDIKYIPAGIQDNVALKSARVTTSPQGNPFLEIVFEKDGATLTQTEWKPTKFGNMTDEDLQNKEDTQFSRMMQILTCFYTEDELVFNGTNFTDWANEVADYLNKADKTKLLRLKVVYNNKGYTTLPSYAKYTFAEPTNIFIKSVLYDTKQTKQYRSKYGS